MRILVTANITPFLQGGADYHINGLVAALKRYGHQVELLRFPFQFSPDTAITSAMDYMETLDLNSPNGFYIDRLISLQFPTYGIQHDDHWVWLMHQHRAVYELYNPQENKALSRLRNRIHAYDTQKLSIVDRVFANSARVAERLAHYNHINSKPLYHPPTMAEEFYCATAQGYVFYPSRLESLKRQDLLIEAARYVKSDIKILIAGSGGQKARYQQLIERYKLQHRVRLLGYLSEAEKLSYYAHAEAVYFAPFDEDYGYITLEAMLSSKPVITATDSGGPLEFVIPNETGWVIEPEAKQLAGVLDKIAAQPEKNQKMGEKAHEHYASLNISWQHVVNQLTASASSI